MNFRPTKLDGVWIIDPERSGDDRGWFARTFCTDAFAAHGIRLFDVEELPTHGGSLRIFGCRAEADRPATPAVNALRSREEAAGLDRLATYDGFAERVKTVKRRLLSFLVSTKNAGKSIDCYGAEAKRNTLLNYFGDRTYLLDYVVDASPHKQGLMLPGTRIPIMAPSRLRETRPDYVLILPWNLKEEIVEQMADVRSWGGRFVVAIPEVEILE